LREEGTALDEMAVLYRSHFHALEPAVRLTCRNIPFSITSGIRFFEQAHRRTWPATLLVCNEDETLSNGWSRCSQAGPKAADKLGKSGPENT
jgi:DNA helicase-2/ATP-dependent DNA helicase PcrA